MGLVALLACAASRRPPSDRELRFTTKAYQDAALSVMLEEVNRIRADLHLPEHNPVRTSHLYEVFMPTPAMSDYIGVFATVRTTNYIYSAAVGNKLSYVMKAYPGGQKQRNEEVEFLRANCTLPMEQLDKARAYSLATQWLAAASMNVESLNRDFTLDITTWRYGEGFVPVYWVRWLWHDLPICTVELFEPTGELRQLCVNDVKYIDRRVLSVPDRDQLLTVTNHNERVGGGKAGRGP